MNDQTSPTDIDSVLVQLALQTRENAVKKVQIHHQIKGLRSDIAEKSSLVQTLETNIEKLTEEIKLKQNTLTCHTETVKSMRASNRRLHQYEQHLKERARSQLDSYNQELEVLEEKYASCKNTFQSYREYYCRHPLAQKLLALQTEKEEIERRIKACDGEITRKEKELTHLSDIFANSEERTKCSDQELLKEPENQLNPHPEEDSASSIHISSFHIEQTTDQSSQNSHKPPVRANSDDGGDVQNMADSIGTPEDPGDELSSAQRLNEQTRYHGKPSEEPDQETAPENNVEQQSSVGVTGEAEDQNMTGLALDEEQAPVGENAEAFPKPTCPSLETSLQYLPAAGRTVPSTSASTPLFSFSFSPGGSPLQGAPHSKSPAFPFSLDSDPSPAVFPGFRFDMGSTQMEDTSFGFSGSFFSEKKSTDPKASSCPEFVFNQQEQREDFQFDFSSTSPQKDNKDSRFPFSFNF